MHSECNTLWYDCNDQSAKEDAHIAEKKRKLSHGSVSFFARPEGHTSSSSRSRERFRLIKMCLDKVDLMFQHRKH